jgi:hypothetical protein
MYNEDEFSNFEFDAKIPSLGIIMSVVFIVHKVITIILN